jgi:hypothetical protein
MVTIKEYSNQKGSFMAQNVNNFISDIIPSQSSTLNSNFFQFDPIPEPYKFHIGKSATNIVDANLVDQTEALLRESNFADTNIAFHMGAPKGAGAPFVGVGSELSAGHVGIIIDPKRYEEILNPKINLKQRVLHPLKTRNIQKEQFVGGGFQATVGGPNSNFSHEKLGRILDAEGIKIPQKLENITRATFYGAEEFSAAAFEHPINIAYHELTHGFSDISGRRAATQNEPISNLYGWVTQRKDPRYKKGWIGGVAENYRQVMIQSGIEEGIAESGRIRMHAVHANSKVTDSNPINLGRVAYADHGPEVFGPMYTDSYYDSLVTEARRAGAPLRRKERKILKQTLNDQRHYGHIATVGTVIENTKDIEAFDAKRLGLLQYMESLADQDYMYNAAKYELLDSEGNFRKAQQLKMVVDSPMHGQPLAAKPKAIGAIASDVVESVENIAPKSPSVVINRSNRGVQAARQASKAVTMGKRGSGALREAGALLSILRARL